MAYKNEVKNPVPVPYITAQMNFIFRARMIWRDLATWLRSYNNDVDEINSLTQQALFTGLQIQESTTFLTKDYTVNNDIFDRILSFTNLIRDYFSEGLTNYFILKQQQQAT